jgi:xanthine dehydrogenase accessory factor
MSGKMRESFADLDRWLGEGEEIALATLVRVRGSAPRPPGARLFVTRSGRMSGSVSAGCVENDVLERAQQVLQDGLAVVADYGIADELSFQVGLSCGGSLEVLIEPFREDAAWRAVRDAVEAERPAALAVGLAPRELRGRRLAVPADGAPVGSIDPELDPHLGAEARRLLPLGETREVSLPWSDGEARVRGVFATEERFPEADELVRSWPGEVLQEARLDAWSYVVTLSHDPKFDIPTLAQALRSDACYIGALGSRATQEKRRKQLLDQGFENAELARICGPIGLDIGARAPEEIALAILAEMVAVRHGREGAALRRRRTPIHAEG